jgi:hypothetical protein
MDVFFLKDGIPNDKEGKEAWKSCVLQFLELTQVFSFFSPLENT